MRRYNSRHDAYYDPLRGRWLEPACGDPRCEYCATRPERPGLTWRYWFLLLCALVLVVAVVAPALGAHVIPPVSMTKRVQGVKKNGVYFHCTLNPPHPLVSFCTHFYPPDRPDPRE